MGVDRTLHARSLTGEIIPPSPKENRPASPVSGSYTRPYCWNDGHDMNGRMSVPEIARRLNIGRLAVYTMLEQGLLPGIRLGRRWIVTRAAFNAWEKTCGARTATPTGTGFQPDSEVTVVN